MKRVFMVFLVAAALSAVGCTRHIRPEKFDVYPELIGAFSGDRPIHVVVPENAEKEYLIGYKGPNQPAGKIYVDLNDMYAIAGALVEETLTRRGVPVAADAEKRIGFTIEQVQWEVWAGGFSIGAYLRFTVETGDGYRFSDTVQDGSSMDVNRAVGGTISRAVEKMFQDPGILAYIAK